MVTMKTSIACLFLLGIVSIHAATTPQNSVSNQEIRDAILSLVHSISITDNKLERHEQRERALGELLKKGLMTLQKNQRIFEPIKGSFDRLDKRVSEIESMLLKNEKQTAEEQSKLTNLLEKILKAFEVSAQVSSRVSDKSEEDEENLSKKFDELKDTVKALRRDISELKAEQNNIETSNKNLVAQTTELVKGRIAQTDSIAQKLEEKLSQFYITDNSKSSEFEEKVAESLQEIKEDVKELLVKAPPTPIAGFTKDDRLFLTELNNDTKDAIDDMRLEVLTASDKSFAKTASRIKESHDTIEDVSKTLTEFTNVAESFYIDSFKSSSDLKTSVDGLHKLEKILLDTSNNVLETKRRFEYGIHQIILEVGDVMKTANASMQKRLNELNDGILENHNIALTNLSTKIETEMSQVWRQIGIMYQEITSSKKALDRLQEQTEVYVNGTITTMDSMEGKVGLITNRMQEVDANLNYLLGRLLLVTQEFNQIKLGLGDALDNIRSSFMTVQDKVRQNAGPGPHPIKDQELENEENLNPLSKRSVRSFPFQLKLRNA